MDDLECRCKLCSGVIRGANGAKWSDLMAERVRERPDIRCCYYFQGRHESNCGNKQRLTHRRSR